MYVSGSLSSTRVLEINLGPPTSSGVTSKLTMVRRDNYCKAMTLKLTIFWSSRRKGLDMARGELATTTQFIALYTVSKSPSMQRSVIPSMVSPGLSANKTSRFQISKRFSSTWTRIKRRPHRKDCLSRVPIWCQLVPLGKGYPTRVLHQFTQRVFSLGNSMTLQARRPSHMGFLSLLFNSPRWNIFDMGT